MKGLGTALITPFTKEGEVDYAALSKLIEHQIAGGADYLVLLGTTSEVPTLTHIEQDAIIDFAVKQVEGRVPMILGIGGNSTHAVVGRINELKEILEGRGNVSAFKPRENLKEFLLDVKGKGIKIGLF